MRTNPETFLKYVNGVTKEVESRHPIGLFEPDADDILLGEFHWVSVGCLRTFPIPYDNYWYNQYKMNNVKEKQRSLTLHQYMCQKILYTRGSGSSGSDSKRLLLRSHLSPCINEFQELYPDATIVGIVRNPIDVLRSFFGLSRCVIHSTSNGRHQSMTLHA